VPYRHGPILPKYCNAAAVTIPGAPNLVFFNLLKEGLRLGPSILDFCFPMAARSVADPNA
jgi:hypothetical protein